MATIVSYNMPWQEVLLTTALPCLVRLTIHGKVDRQQQIVRAQREKKGGKGSRAKAEIICKKQVLMMAGVRKKEMKLFW